MSFQVGQEVCEYEILNPLGTGGMGCVYRVRHKISGRIEALKILLPDVQAEPQLGERFLSEIQTLARLEHPNIAQLYTAQRFENQLFMVMELVEGKSLDQLTEEPKPPLGERLRWIEQVLAALSFAHANGVIHRDVKPANIMMSPNGTVKLLDFGIAKTHVDRALTQAGATVGSIPYMSPEQVRGVQVDARSDLYSTGIVLYELATGQRPFQADSAYHLLEMHVSTPPRPPVELCSSLLPELNEIILTALEKAPERRFQNAEAFRRALGTVRSRLAGASADAATRTATAKPPIVPPVAAVPKRRRALWLAAGALAAVLVLAGGATFLPVSWKTHAQPNQVQPQSAPITATQQPEQSATVEPSPNRTDNQPVNTTVRHATVRPPSEPVPEKRTQPAPLPEQVSPPAVEAPAQATAPSAAEVEALETRIGQVRARAAVVRDAVERIRAQQAASGLGLRQDIAGALVRLEMRLTDLDRAGQAGDMTAANKAADGAENELNTLDRFMGR